MIEEVAIEINVDGRIKTATPVNNPGKYKGWIAAAMRHAIQAEGDVPSIPISSGRERVSVLRILHPAFPARAPAVYMLHSMHPVNTLNGIPATTYEPLINAGLTLDEAKLTYSFLARQRLIVFTPSKVSVEKITVQGGVRDDPSTISTTNPHTENFLVVKEPITVKFRIVKWPEDFELRPPEQVPGITPSLQGLTYAEAFDKLFDMAIKTIKNEMMSPFGGRRYHTIDVEVTSKRVIAENAPGIRITGLDQNILNRVAAKMARRYHQEYQSLIGQASQHQGQGYGRGQGYRHHQHRRGGFV